MIDRFKSTLRDETRIDIIAYIRGIERKLTDPKQFPFRNCLNCRNFSEITEVCTLANQRPPVKVICYGCDKHDDVEGVPF